VIIKDAKVVKKTVKKNTTFMLFADCLNSSTFAANFITKYQK
jgi:hypothetical protein